MTQPMEDIEALRQLMERLRARVFCGEIDDYSPINPDGSEAADAIEAMTAELEALRAERGRMVEALEPFAKYRGSDEYLRSASDDGLCQAVSFTAGDYRRARAAYQHKEPGS